VIVALLMAGVAMLSLSFLTVLRSSHLENQGSRESLSALYACEAGLSLALDELKLGADGDIGTENAPIASGGHEFWVEATDIGDGRIALVSRGSDDDASMGVELVVQPEASGFFRWAAFGDEELHMDSNSRTDSYDSADGTYASQQVNGSGSNAYANTDGDVGSNGSITMDSNVGVWGDASPGPGGSVSGNLANISGSTTPTSSTIALPAIVLPAAPSATDLTVSTASYTLASGTHSFAKLQVNVGKSLHVVGPATIVCNDFVLKSNSSVTVDASAGKVEFFVVNDFVLNSNTTIASDDNEPADIAFNLLSDNVLDPGIDVNFDEDLVDFDSGSKMYATIYAPSAAITIDSNFELFGSLVARRVDLDSNCRIHFDEALATAANGGEVAYQSLCWRVIARP
jgi:hypothetical protein